MMNIRRTIRKGLHQLGLELTRAPVPNWTRYRWAILPVLDRFHINCVLDVGANVGQFGHSLRELDYGGWIISFEPVSGPRVRLEQAAKADGKWRVCPYALGSIEGEAEIHVMAGSVFSSFLEPATDVATLWDAGNFVQRGERVSVHRLDAVLDECLADIRNPNIYLKMDTQGFDAEVLSGAENVMHRISALQTETAFRKIYQGMKGFDEVLPKIMSYGFGVVDFVPVTRERDGLRVIEMDCILCRDASRDGRP